MTWLIGVDFRQFASYVTDPSGYGPPGYVAELATAGNDYTAVQGYGWETGISGGSDGTTANGDARIAGSAYTADPLVGTFRIDLPAAGTYNIQLALGNAQGGANTERAELFDDTTSLGVLVNDQLSAAGSGTFTGFDAQDNDYDGTAGHDYNAWIANNPLGGGGAGSRNFTFSSTILRLKIGNASGSSYTALAHLMVMQVASAAGNSGLPLLGVGGRLAVSAIGARALGDALKRNRVLTRRRLWTGRWR